jgi:hypothetical protein
VVSGSWDCTLRVWDLETGVCERVLRGHAGVSEITISSFSLIPFSSFIRGSPVFVPCRMVEWCQDLGWIFECGMWRQESVSEC